jgi:hypothetical protein
MEKIWDNPQMTYEEEAKAKEKAMRARVDGRTKVAQRTVWTLVIAHLNFRCLAEPTMYVVQIKVGNTPWTTVKAGKNAEALLKHSLSVKSVAEAFAKYPDFGVG